ncbi:glycosyltransferase [Thalassotalea sp. 1_MG-2023]|uniref:glycosyltransferase n=1 Tax=Thalassotalea sp. 1_MG-2023 TaxID=3062680 RepID=UPI0026E16AC7|nr:glycosyltransferase [Thalassotalea sp. 1_MG-2023]MDO6425486.1 glycosyltransferase [Thalassotalea sp. 1_MG-2023]
MSTRKTIAHLILQLDIGGLERVMLNCIRQMQQQSDVKHVIISLTTANNFSQSDLNEQVPVYCLHKKAGNDWKLHFRLFQLLREIKPDILHSYNLSTIEYHPIAMLAGVKGRIHAEHGRDINDPQGLNKKHNVLRKLMSLFIHRYIAVSQELFQWLNTTVGISTKKTQLIANGINTELFNLPKQHSQHIRFANIARLSPIKDHKNLLRACQLLQQDHGEQAWSMTIIGDGPLRQELELLTQEYQLNERVHFLGARDDIAQLLTQVDVFVLSSIAEGIPMTILEAMSASTAIIATEVGGIPQVIEQHKEGILVEKQNSVELEKAMAFYLDNVEKTTEHGEQAREKVLNSYNEQRMVKDYLACYDQLL